MATSTLVYANVNDIADWTWETLERSETVHDTDDNADYLDIDLYPTGIRVYFDKAPESDGRFELGDIADIYSYSQREPGSINFLAEVANAESLEEFYAILENHVADFTD